MEPLPPMRPPGPSMPPDMYCTQQFVNIEKPTESDVLCGRGVTTNRHVGNENFRSLVNCNKELYVSSTKKQKMRISRSIVEAVRSLDPPGRFLEKDQNSQTWFDIGDKKAVEKTSQALRDGAAGLRKQLSEDLNDPDFLSAVFDMDVVPEEKKAPAPKKDPKKTPLKKGHRRTMSNPTVESNTAKGKVMGLKRVSIDKLPMSPRATVSYMLSPKPPMSPMSPRSTPTSPRIYTHPPRTLGPPVHRRIHSSSSVPYTNQLAPKSPGAQSHYTYLRHPSPYHRTHPIRHSTSPIYPDNAEHRYSPRCHQQPPPTFGPSTPIYSSSPSRKLLTSPYPSSHHSMPPPQYMPPSSMPPPNRSPRHPSSHPTRIYPKPLSPRFSPGYGMTTHRSPHPYMPPPEYRSPEYRPPSTSPRNYTPNSRYYPPPPTSSPHLSVPTLGGEHPSSRRPLPMSPARYPPPSPRSAGYHYATETPVEFSPPITSSTRTPSPPFQAPPAQVTRINREKADADMFQPPPPKITKKEVCENNFKEESNPNKQRGARGPLDERTVSSHKSVSPSKVVSEVIIRTEEVTSSPRENSPSAVADVQEHEKSNEKTANKREDAMQVDEEEFPFDEGPETSLLPFEQKEDPTTLMELPENILTLPISPCGPHDDSCSGNKRKGITA